MPILCPYCGHTQQKSDQCEQCNGLFEPLSRCATQIAMGPWYVRDEKRPFMPGFCFDVLSRQVKSGKIKRTSIVRGPTTHQFWASAEHVPGVAHLLGACHACGAEVRADDTSCPQCGAMFAVHTDRNRLGMPTMPPAHVMNEMRRRHPQLCPVCGTTGESGPRCGACGQAFESSNNAGTVSVGPWAVRDPKRPYLKGVSYDELKRRIEAGEIHATTVMRGPTTQQFWSIGLNTPGIAHRLGRCHACGESVEPAASACPSCGASFDVGRTPGELGLLFPTEQAAAAAQKRLDAALAAQAPGAAPSASSASMVNALDAGLLPALKTEQYEAPAGMAAPAGASGAPAAAAFDATPSPPRVDTSRTIARRHGRRGRKRNDATAILALSITGVLAIVVLIVLVQMNVIPSPGARSKEPEPPIEKPVELAMATPGQKQRKGELEQWYVRLRDAKTPQSVVPKLDEATAVMRRINQLWTDGKFDEAERVFPEFSAALDGVERAKMEAADQAAARKEAEVAREELSKAAKTAADAGAKDLAQPMWDAAVAAAEKGQGHFDAGENLDAMMVWQEATTKYLAAADHAKLGKQAKAAREDFVEALTRNYPKERLEADGGALWPNVMGVVATGDEHLAKSEYDKALSSYERAESMISDLESAVRQVEGVKFFAFDAGYVVTDALLHRASDKPLDEARRTAIRKTFEALRLDEKFLAALPTAGDVEYATLAKTLVTDARAAVDAQRGEAAGRSFNIGFQVRIVERLLEGEGGLLSRTDKTEIERSLALIEREAKTAGWTDTIGEKIKALREAMNKTPEFEALKEARAEWAALIVTLRDYNSGIKIINTATAGATQ